jgi:flagellar assembly factor FliW
MIKIQDKEFVYDENEVISFTEGLIGLPEIRRAVLISIDGFEPFFWLASVEDQQNRFVVVDPREIFDGYEPFSADSPDRFETKTLSIVKISSNWEKTTVNLRAPIFINPRSKRGAQCVLTDSNYSLTESFPNV